MNKKIIAIIAVLVVAFVATLTLTFPKAANGSPSVDEQIRLNLTRQGELQTEINLLKGEKNNCLDNLTYLQTKKHGAGIEKFCFEWDEQIIADRALLSELYDEMKNLTTHEYELGLK